MNAREQKWNDNLQKLVNYYDEHKKIPCYKKGGDEAVNKIAKWAQYQKYKRTTLKQERIDALNELEFWSWSVAKKTRKNTDQVISENVEQSEPKATKEKRVRKSKKTSEISEQVDVAPKKRGRPKKNLVNQNTNEIQNENVVKKKPGRPKKVRNNNVDKTLENDNVEIVGSKTVFRLADTVETIDIKNEDINVYEQIIQNNEYENDEIDFNVGNEEYEETESVEVVCEDKNEKETKSVEVVCEDKNEKETESVEVVCEDKNEKETENTKVVCEDKNEKETENTKVVREDKNEKETENTKVVREDKNEKETENTKVVIGDKNKKKIKDPLFVDSSDDDYEPFSFDFYDENYVDMMNSEEEEEDRRGHHKEIDENLDKDFNTIEPVVIALMRWYKRFHKDDPKHPDNKKEKKGFVIDEERNRQIMEDFGDISRFYNKHAEQKRILKMRADNRREQRRLRMEKEKLEEQKRQEKLQKRQEKLNKTKSKKQVKKVEEPNKSFIDDMEEEMPLFECIEKTKSPIYKPCSPPASYKLNASSIMFSKMDESIENKNINDSLKSIKDKSSVASIFEDNDTDVLMPTTIAKKQTIRGRPKKFSNQ